MHSSEFDDFKNELSRNGYNLNDFELNHTDLTNWQPNQIVTIQGSITIKRKSTKKEKSYNTGSGTHWVVDFSDDLKSGFFN